MFIRSTFLIMLINSTLLLSAYYVPGCILGSGSRDEELSSCSHGVDGFIEIGNLDCRNHSFL